jgi:phytoene dehydrogenase-like protein
VFDIEKLKFVHPEEFVRVETEQGERLIIYSNVDRLEAELVQQAPQDAAEIRRLTWAIRRLTNFPLPDPSEPWPSTVRPRINFFPCLDEWAERSICGRWFAGDYTTDPREVR